MRVLSTFLKNQSGATAVEYGILALGIAMAIVVVVGLIGTNLSDGAYTDMTTLF